MASCVSSGCGSKFAAANALKRQCHNVINALGPQTPPEVFVYRGNAYRDLQQPYLALADYNTANRVIKTSGQHQEACKEALKALPRRLTANYPAADNHLHLIVDPLFGKGIARRSSARNPEMGRGIFTATDLKLDDIVLQTSTPWLLYPLKEGFCSNCSKKLPPRVFGCTNEKCHEEYCSRDCRSHALTLYHGKVCQNEGFQSIELDLFAQMTAATSATRRNVLAGYLLTLRVVAASLLNRTVPTAIAEVRSLTGKLVFDPNDIAEEMLDLYDRLARFCGFVTSIHFEEFIGVYARIRSNSFQMNGSLAWHVPRSMFNHSCDPNCVVDHTGVFRAAQNIKAGDELTISYFPHLNQLPSEARRIELQNRDFTCLCPRCVAGY
jgi:hypothetical protein